MLVVQEMKIKVIQDETDKRIFESLTEEGQKELLEDMRNGLEQFFRSQLQEHCHSIETKVSVEFPSEGKED